MSDVQIVRTSCNRDCPDACGILAHVRGDRVERLQGDPEHPVTQGFLCYRTDQFLHRQYSPERLATPLVRRGGSLEPASWEEALDLCARTLLRVREESGPSAIFHYRSGGSLGLMKHVTDHFWSRFGPVTVKRGDICGGAGDAAQMTDFGAEDANDLHDLRHARAVVLWGKNPHTSSPHLLPILRGLRKDGVPVALVDPVRHRGASLASLYVQPRPGGDASLALGVARGLFERGLAHPEAHTWCDNLEAFRALAFGRTLDQHAADAGVPRAALDALTELYGAHSPAAILVGWGMGRRSNGSAIVRCLDALGALTGNLGVAGGGVSFYFLRRAAFDLAWVDVAPAPRTVCEPLFGQELLTLKNPELRAVWVTAGNPVTMLPDSHRTAEALRSREFVVVADSFLTDTARLATVVLPVTTMLEDDDLVGAYGHHYLGVVRPVVPPPEGVRTDYQVTQGLAERVGLGEHFLGDARSWKRRLLRAIPLETLEAGPLRNPEAPRVAFEGRRFRTPSGKVNLVTALPAPRDDSSVEFPLLLHALSTPASQSSQWSPREPEERPSATVHPSAAAGLPEGAVARVVTALGALEVTVRHDPTLHHKIVLLPKGGSLGLHRCANALISPRLTDAGEGGALYEEPARLEAL
ncbi:MAG: molybdopterin-dependent oxidoreductase [Deltaproteobacteria bacterium]|nr:molybdopterin-dependent oxidoreductase [Deltaproteobacteria bacterium]